MSVSALLLAGSPHAARLTTAWASLGILAITSIVLWIWYRNICRTLLSGRGLDESGAEFLRINSLESPFRTEAWRRGDESLDVVRVSLSEDFQLCSFLLRNGFSYAGINRSLDIAFLRLNFHFQTWADQLLGRWNSQLAESTIIERARIIIFFANAMAAPPPESGANQPELPASLQ
jgi:hypothetical protein